MFASVAIGLNEVYRVNVINGPQMFETFEVDTIYDLLPIIEHANVQYRPSNSLIFKKNKRFIIKLFVEKDTYTYRLFVTSSFID